VRTGNGRVGARGAPYNQWEKAPVATEIELKLLLDPAQLARVARHPALRALRRGRTRTRKLHNVYYDTPRRDLLKAGAALRLRQDGTRWLQTLKTGGGAAGGLHSRNEW